MERSVYFGMFCLVHLDLRGGVFFWLFVAVPSGVQVWVFVIGAVVCFLCFLAPSLSLLNILFSNNYEGNCHPLEATFSWWYICFYPLREAFVKHLVFQELWRNYCPLEAFFFGRTPPPPPPLKSPLNTNWHWLGEMGSRALISPAKIHGRDLGGVRKVISRAKVILGTRDYISHQHYYLFK